MSCSRSWTVRRSAAAAITVAALAGCSFRGSASDPDASGRSPSAAAPATAAPLSTPATAGAGVTSTSSPQPGAGATSTAATGGSPRISAPPAPAPGSTVDRCHTSELTPTLSLGSPGAGQRYASLALRDTGGRTCTVEGYGGVGLYDSAGRALPTQQVRVAAPTPRLVTVRPGASVTSQLQWSAVAGVGDSQTGDCQPVAATLRVIPPGETDALSLDWPGGPVCEAGTIQQQPYTG